MTPHPFKRRMAPYLFFLLSAACTCVPRAWSATSSEEIPTLDPVIVTATKTEVPLMEAAASVTLIDLKTIEEKHLTTVVEALREVPGLSVAQRGGPGGTASVHLRGTKAEHALVLVDGVPVNSPTTGAFDFSDLTLDNIERIEVIRGPQSTLYGSEAIGGVIQIFTKKGQGPPTGALSFEAGAYRTFRETIEWRGSTGRMDYSLSANRLDTRGFSRANERAGNVEDDGYQSTTLSTRFGFDLTEKTQLEWTTRYTESESDLDGCDPVTFFCPVDDPNFVQESRQWMTALGLKTTLVEGWQQHLKLAVNADHLQFIDPDPEAAFNNSEIDTSRRVLDWRHDVSLGSRDLLTVGYEYESQRGQSPGSFDEATRNHAGYALNQLRLLPLILNLGLRYDHNSRYGNETTYKVETAYLIHATQSKIRTAYGTGFHGPTLNDLFFPGFGNPDLKPERSRSIEAGMEQALWKERLLIGATYFQNRIEDLIVFVSDPVTFAGMPENVDRAKAAGWEFEISARPAERVVLLAHYTLTDTEDEETGAELPRRPRHKASGSLSLHPVDSLRLTLQVRYVGKRFDDTANRIEMGDYTVFDLAGTYAFHPQLSLFARLENLFDRSYEEVAGYGTPGFSGYGGVKVSF